MRILKNISIFFLLIVLTSCVVFGPQLISGQSEEKILNEIVYRSYSTGNRPKPTSHQVALLYYNREISFEYNLSPEISEDRDDETVRETITELIEMMFGEEEAICDSIKALLTDGNTSYSRHSSLFKIDNQPTALNFASYSIMNESGFFEILYEEKTKTIIRLCCDVWKEEFEAIKDRDLYHEKAVSAIKNYFEKQLELSSGQYLFTADVLEIKEKGGYVNIAIGCEIMQFEDKIIEDW